MGKRVNYSIKCITCKDCYSYRDENYPDTQAEPLNEMLIVGIKPKFSVSFGKTFRGILHNFESF